MCALRNKSIINSPIFQERPKQNAKSVFFTHEIRGREARSFSAKTNVCVLKGSIIKKKKKKKRYVRTKRRGAFNFLYIVNCFFRRGEKRRPL